MDKEALIAAVFERRPIWDKRDKLHCNRNVIDKYWKEISTQMKENEAKVRKQWKYLRDQFSVELGKYPPPRSGDPADDVPASNWPYFSLLLFLKDIVKPRATTGNLSSTQSTCYTQMTDQEETQSVECDENSDNEDASQASEHEQENAIETSVMSPTSTKTTPIPTPVTTKKRRGTPDAFQASILDIERRKVDYLESKTKRSCSGDQDDEHLSFFKSLLPHVRKIPENRILSFRCRVQELVDKYSYQLNTCPRPFSSTSSHSSAPSPGYHNIDQNDHTSISLSQLNNCPRPLSSSSSHSSVPSPGYQNAYSSVSLSQQSTTSQSHLANIPRPIESNQQQNITNNTTDYSFLLPNENISPWS